MTNRSNLDIVRATYEGKSEDNGRNLLAALAPDAEWTEAAGFPYAGTYVGPQAIVENVFQRLGGEWDGYRAAVDHYYVDGDNVVAQGFYHGTYRATGKSFTASFAHVYTLKDGRIVKFEQIVDSAKVWEAMRP
ncbi:nuclear transport factor 2 family protein [Chromobacterium vaccinii]|uniref:nuclear transport factor 2 family protein n=1 Tax=Chromobacterium vaccinii TaxID=1108595 RepID=UPI001E4913B5|nr:nuclear transport factor 2 family protein [Chromobacterium vaccinii]MCD4485775.1 nuclear transport factor 2 family protein [Chromobacterium vaccinii]MCD4500799.1 nuclear transport factor 2 family protein [Chromobacterium vaccinii]